MAEIPLNSGLYRTGRLDPMTTFHVGRRILPLIPDIGPALQRIFAGLETIFGTPGATAPSLNIADFLNELRPLEVLAKLSNAEVEEIIYPCLAVCERKQKLPSGNEAWTAVMPSPGRFTFPDTTMGDMLRLAWEVLRENVLPFSPAAGNPGATTQPMPPVPIRGRR